MCLETISKRKPVKTGFGWKVFIRTKDPKVLHGAVFDEIARPVGEWLDAERNLVTERPGAPYLSGFHILKTLKAAREYQSFYSNGALHRVQYAKARLQGNGGACKNDRQVIADRMKILAEVK